MCDQSLLLVRIWPFHQSDPYQASGGPADPGSWNRYAYVLGDPISYNDRAGLAAGKVECGSDFCVDVASTPIGVPITDIFSPRPTGPREIFIPLPLEREMRCEDQVSNASANDLLEIGLELASFVPGPVGVVASIPSIVEDWQNGAKVSAGVTAACAMFGPAGKIIRGISRAAISVSC